MNQPQPAQFDATQVPIQYTLNFHQVNLILKGMAKLPLEEVEQLYTGLRAHALGTLQAAEAEFKAQQEAAATATPEVPPAEGVA